MTKIQPQSPLAVANFVIEIAKEQNNPVTNLKLQKVLFFLQGFCLYKYQEKLINGCFSKWKYGPVEETVYNNFKSNGALPINDMYIDIFFDRGSIKSKEVRISTLNQDILSELKKTTKSIIHIEPWELVRMTHSHSSWSDYEEDILKRKSLDYTNEEIKKCYEDNQERLKEYAS